MTHSTGLELPQRLSPADWQPSEPMVDGASANLQEIITQARLRLETQGREAALRHLQEQYPAGGSEGVDVPALLAGLGFPARNRVEPGADRVPADMWPGLETYCLNLPTRVARGEGLSLTGGVGAGKTSALAWLAWYAALAGVPCAYCLAGWDAVDAIRQEGSRVWQTVPLLLLDDLDYVSSEGYEGEVRSWDALGRFLYLRDAEGLSVIWASNLAYHEVCRKPGMARVASRWEVSIPTQFRLGTMAGDQRVSSG